jgi:hypothetical protein
MKYTRTLILKDDAQIVGRATAEVLQRQSVVVPASLENQYVMSAGGKCDHGVYIPAAFLHTDSAPYCSICHPYEIIAKEHAAYKA